uniref:Uncharacterized protein LOC104266336 n=1 Tax=Phallusia mammillata TaxID=59560 RepID=A0A6F9DIG2_9ASCI|nr:uncharacterized protein LOC104266336 [Phallusia mammillata]
MALFTTPTKNQLVENAGDIVKTYVFTKIAVTSIVNGYATEISLVAIHQNDILRNMEMNMDNYKPPRIIDKLTIFLDAQQPIDKHLSAVFKLKTEDLHAAHKSAFDSDAVGLIYGFLERQEAPVCLVCHNGFRLDFPLLKHHLNSMDRSIDKISGSDLLCSDSLWTCKMLDASKESLTKRGVSVFDMLYYTQNSLHERLVNKPMPACLTCEEINMFLLEMCIRMGDTFVQSLCCKKFSDVVNTRNNKNTTICNNILATTENTGTFVFFDLETTGLINPKITEICMMAVNKSSLQATDVGAFPRVIDKLLVVVDPDEEIEPVASQLTKLSNVNISERNKATFGTNTSLLVAQFLNRQKGPVCVIAHNGDGFDFPILQSYLDSCVSDTFNNVYSADTLIGLRFLLQPVSDDAPKVSCALKDVYKRYFPQQPLESMHEAESDVVSLMKIVRANPELERWLDENKKLLIA